MSRLSAAICDISNNSSAQVSFAKSLIIILVLVLEYQVIAESLWDEIHVDTTQYHERFVELFLQLHNLTPSSLLCANVIGNSLVDISKVRAYSHLDNFILRANGDRVGYVYPSLPRGFP